jgi:hypothetical protein
LLLIVPVFVEEVLPEEVLAGFACVLSEEVESNGFTPASSIFFTIYTFDVARISSLGP